MWRFAAALPFTNLPGFRLREDDREPELGERRRVFLRRFPPELEARFLRRLRPPLREGIEPGQPFIHDISVPCSGGNWGGGLEPELGRELRVELLELEGGSVTV